MMQLNPAQLVLQARIAMLKLRLIPSVAALLCIVGAAAWLWFACAMRTQDARQASGTAQRATPEHDPVPGSVTQGGTDDRNAHAFYEALGDPHYAEQYIKTLFAVAEKEGLQLDQGEYKWQPDKNSMTVRYQVLLPLKGSYRAIRQFCRRTLRAVPFMSLDELSFKREAIADDALDATLHLTFYLRATPPLAAGSGSHAGDIN